MAGITIKIGGIDKTEYIDARTLSIRDELTSKVNSASFDFICNNIAVVPKPGEAVLIEEGTKKLFSGRILSKEESFLPPNLLKYLVECIDHTRDLDKKLVAESYVNQKAGDIVKDIINKYTTYFVIPTGYNDPDGEWTDETLAYDGYIDTYANRPQIPGHTWTTFLELTHASMLCKGIRFSAWNDKDYISTIDIDAYYGGTWNHVYEGVYANEEWVKKLLASPQYITAFRFRFYNNDASIIFDAWLYEVNFIPFPSDIFTTINVSDGPTISEIAFDYVQVSDAITKIAEICGYEWYVDYDRDIHFFDKNTYPAPFQLDDEQANYKDLIINTDISQLRNRIFVKSSMLKDIFGEVFIGDGVTDHWTCKYKAEIMLPEKIDTDTLRWYGNAVEFSHSDTYLAVGLDWVLGMPECPDIRIFKRDGDTFTKIADPDTLPTGNAYGVAWSSDDTYLAVGHEYSPYITIYKRDEDVFTKLDNPADLPTGHGNGLSFGYNDTYLAISHTTTPYITIYKRAGDVFTKLSNPAILPTGTGEGASFSPDGIYLTVAHVTSPYVTIYKRTGNTFTKLANPASLPTGNAHDVAFSPDGVYLAVGHTTSPFVTIYKRNGDVFTKLDDPDVLPEGLVNGVAFAPNSTHLAVAHDNSPYMILYKRGGDTFVKVENPSPLPAGNGLSAAFSYKNRYIAVGHEYSPRLTIYKHYVPLIKVDGVYKTVGWDGIDNPNYFDYMLDADTKVLSLGIGTGTPAVDVELLIIYTVLGMPLCFRRDDQDSIDTVKANEGGDGVFEFCLVDNNIDSIAWANEAAKADLLKNADPTIKATFITNRSDIKTGQIITLSSIKRDINQQFIVQKVELVRVDVITEWPTITYKPAAEAKIGYKPASEAEEGYRAAGDSGDIIYYIFNVTIANKFKKLEDLFIYLLNRADESLK